MPAICPPERPLAARTPELGTPAAVADGSPDSVPVGVPEVEDAVPLELDAGAVLAPEVGEELDDVFVGPGVGEVLGELVVPAVGDAVLPVAVAEAGGTDSAVSVPWSVLAAVAVSLGAVDGAAVWDGLAPVFWVGSALVWVGAADVGVGKTCPGVV